MIMKKSRGENEGITENVIENKEAIFHNLPGSRNVEQK